MMRDDWVEVNIELLFESLNNGKDLNQGYSPQCKKTPSPANNIWGVLKTSAIQANSFCEIQNKELPPEKEIKSQFEVNSGDILVTCAGPRNRCGVSCLVKNVRPKLLLSGKMYRFRANEEYILSLFLILYLQSQMAWDLIDKMKTGGNESGLNLTHSRFRKLIIPITSLPEQRAIVGKIEELFSELDNGIENLKIAKERLGLYRQSVLKKAFEGGLTEEWRETQKDLPSAEELLEQIKEARQKHYDDEVSKWKVAVTEWEKNGKEGKKPSKPKKLFESPDITDSEHRVLPVSVFCWERLGKFIDKIEAGKSFRCEERPPKSTEVGVAKVSAISWGVYDEKESKTCTNLSKVIPEYFIEENDFILSRANTIDLVGACVIAKDINRNIMLSDKTLRIRYGWGSPEYYLYYLRSKYGRNQIEERSTGNQDSMRNIGQDRVRSIITPICSLREQEEVVKEIESRLSVCDRLESDIEENLERAESLRQSILKKAFAGELLTQTELEECRNASDYEPASVLLERIKKEQEAIKAMNKRSKKKKATKRASKNG